MITSTTPRFKALKFHRCTDTLGKTEAELSQLNLRLRSIQSHSERFFFQLSTVRVNEKCKGRKAEEEYNSIFSDAPQTAMSESDPFWYFDIE